MSDTKRNYSDDNAERRYQGDNAERRYQGDNAERRYQGDNAERRYQGDNAERRYQGDTRRNYSDDNAERRYQGDTRRNYSDDNARQRRQVAPDTRRSHKCNCDHDTSSLYEQPLTYRPNKAPSIPIKLHNLKLEDEDGTISPIATNRDVQRRDPSPPHTPARRSRKSEIGNAVSRKDDGSLVAFNCEYVRADKNGVQIMTMPRDKTEITYNNGKFTFSIRSV